MSVEYRIKPAESLIEIGLSDPCDLQDLMAGMTRLMSDPEYSEHYNAIVDLTNVIPMLTHRELAALARFVCEAPRAPQGIWAAVATEPQVTAFAMLYQRLMLAQHAFVIFYERESALTFLKAPSAKLLIPS